MTVQHNVITDPDLHEPKGVASAASGTVYKADGTGSGTWVYPLTGLDTATSGQVFESDGSSSGTWKYPPAKGHAELYINSGTTAHTLGSGSSYTKLNPGTEWTASGYEDVPSPATNIDNVCPAVALVKPDAITCSVSTPLVGLVTVTTLGDTTPSIANLNL